MSKKNIFSKLSHYISNPLKVKFLLFLMDHGYLYEKGWLNSIVSKEIIDKNLQPLPWLSYPAIDFLNEVLPANAKIFEFGAGNSTLYFANKYASVTSVENDPAWYNSLKHKLKPQINYHLILATEREDYIKSLANSTGKYDLILVDGRWRKPCLIEAARFIENGYIVLDDADREYYKPAIEVLKNDGFYAISFNGMSAGSFDNHSTMIFWRKK